MKTGRIQKEQQEIKNKHQFFHQQEPLVTVGIVSGERISFLLNASYVVDGLVASGEQTAKYVEGQILWKGCLYDSLLFKSDGLHASFSLKDVTIGINFHWERQETQTFAGDLRLIIDGNKIWAVNELPVEEYLKSVISSEMSADASLQLLKAHAVISRSWLLHAMQSRHEEKELTPQPFVDAENMLVRWYDRDDHKLFDVCADDHCQRYQGITRETNPRVAEAISETRGQVLMADGEVCNARFSKCCGGVLEEFQFCWDDSPKSYLVALADTTNEESIPDLTDNATAERWIRSVPDSF
ncbi:MAG: SpoIID/LytB domain-containing protein, partial [Prevotella sp.]